MTEFITANQNTLIWFASAAGTALVVGFYLGRKSKKSISLAPVIRELKNIAAALKDKTP